MPDTNGFGNHGMRGRAERGMLELDMVEYEMRTRMRVCRRTRV